MGNALRAGLTRSRGTYVLLTADDLPFGFDDLDAADRMGAQGMALPRILIGSKANPESVVERGAMRALLTWGFARMRRAILGMRTGDPQGTILIEGELGRRLVRQTTEAGFLFTTELVYLAEREGIRPVEVPVRLDQTHRAHRSRVSARDVLNMGLGLIRVRRIHAGLAARDRE